MESPALDEAQLPRRYGRSLVITVNHRYFAGPVDGTVYGKEQTTAPIVVGSTFGMAPSFVPRVDGRTPRTLVLETTTTRHRMCQNHNNNQLEYNNCRVTGTGQSITLATSGWESNES